MPPLIASDSWGPVDTTPWESNWTEFWDNSASKKVEIDGRNDDEERNWCDEGTREKYQRPGPGILPPLLSHCLHNPEHTLYSVTASAPPPKHSASTSAVPSSSPASAGSSTSLPPHVAPSPSADEIRTAIPHPNAYYCKEHNGWVLLSWCSSTVLPPIIPSYRFERPLPDQARRKRTVSCVGSEDQVVNQANRTHHFHKYSAAVDARTLNIPFKRSEWEAEARQKKRNRSVTLRIEGDEGETSTQGEKNDEPEGDLLDIYVCCQCSVYCLVSRHVIPGVIPLRKVEEFVKDKVENPPVGKNSATAVVSGWETIITILENRLWRGENRVLPVGRPKFQAKIGWSGMVAKVFESLDFTIQSLSGVSEQALHPPSVDPTTPEGKRSRAKLLRAWIEISAWLTLYHKTKPKEMAGYTPQVLHVSVQSATEMIQSAIGAHLNQIPRGLLPPALIGFEPLDRAWEDLGMTPTSYSPELLIFAYLAQCRCDPASTITYFTHFYAIVDTMKNLGISLHDSLEMLVAEERSRHRFTFADYNRAVSLLGFGKDNILHVELEDDVPTKFIIQAWKDAVKRSWHEVDGVQLRTDLNDAFKIVADMRQSSKLRKAWEQEKVSIISPDAAYSTLDVPHETDEEMLVTIFNMRVEDQPGQADKMREALAVIAEVRDSNRLRQFLETGRDPGDPTSETRLDMPRGLNQLGNTCYLNSLLQYFYTIKDLRAAVAPLGGKFGDQSKFTDDELKKHRVGGRMVTRKEIVRSKKFLNQLADLFWNLEYCEHAAVTPSLDLAKLALVTSQDEEEDDQNGGSSTDTSNDTDATLVEDGHPRPAQERTSQSPAREPPSPGSVLGKRNRHPVKKSLDMDVDGEHVDVDKDGFVMVSKPPSSPEIRHASPPASSSPAKLKKAPPRQDDVDSKDKSRKPANDEKAPPLPPRKRTTEDSIMMFGRQHDVSECMDNCMFQIETALLDLHDQEVGSAMTDKTSIIKRRVVVDSRLLFYGKKRQRLTHLRETDAMRPRAHSTHEKEDLFSHLHLNVADEGIDLYDGLGRYFDDVVEVEGTKKRMEVTIVDLPPLLQIQLQRVQFDRETQQAYKSQAYVKFGETLCMDRFLDSANPEKRLRSKEIQARLNACWERIQRFTQGKHAPFAPALGATAEFLSRQPELSAGDTDLIARVTTEQSLVYSQLDQERTTASKLKQELEDVWKYDSAAVYELTSVFIHRGSTPSFGHYFFYSRNLPANPDQWFKYNDSTVTLVSKDEVFADTTGSTANPYMLVYARKGAEVIETVHRFDISALDAEATAA
ncbi:cysteine proteinase [Cytidiella melzeri]|nr:cysteine proteinase [Cytidiella melzeri]